MRFRGLAIDKNCLHMGCFGENQICTVCLSLEKTLHYRILESVDFQNASVSRESEKWQENASNSVQKKTKKGKLQKTQLVETWMTFPEGLWKEALKHHTTEEHGDGDTSELLTLSYESSKKSFFLKTENKTKPG